MRYLTGLILLTIFISCEEDYLLPQEGFSSKMVLNSVFTADSLWVVDLKTSRNIYDESSESTPITDAYVLITEPNGQTACELIHVGQGKYQSQGCFPKVDKKYKISVTSPSYGSMTATSSLPIKAKVKLRKVDTLGTSLSVRFDIEDQSAFNNFYIWDIIEITNREEDTSTVTKGDLNNKLDVTKWVNDLRKDFVKLNTGSITSEVSAVEISNSSDPITTSIVIREFRKDFNTPSNPSIVRKNNYLRIMTVSEELYNYYKSIETYLAYQEYQTSISDPIKTFSNINGGLGIFAGYSLEYIPLNQ